MAGQSDEIFLKRNLDGGESQHNCLRYQFPASKIYGGSSRLNTRLESEQEILCPKLLAGSVSCCDAHVPVVDPFTHCV